MIKKFVMFTLFDNDLMNGFAETATTMEDIAKLGMKPAHQKSKAHSHGWVNTPHNRSPIHDAMPYRMMMFQEEDAIIPADYFNRTYKRLLREAELERGTALARDEKDDIRESLRLELLETAPTKIANTMVVFDYLNDRMLVDTTSQPTIDRIFEHLNLGEVRISPDNVYTDEMITQFMESAIASEHDLNTIPSSKLVFVGDDKERVSFTNTRVRSPELLPFIHSRKLYQMGLTTDKLYFEVNAKGHITGIAANDMADALSSEYECESYLDKVDADLRIGMSIVSEICSAIDKDILIFESDIMYRTSMIAQLAESRAALAKDHPEGEVQGELPLEPASALM